jgi:hypothetical protein
MARENEVYLAKLAEQADRFDGLCFVPLFAFDLSLYLSFAMNLVAWNPINIHCFSFWFESV